jgi:hypothetical protein
MLGRKTPYGVSDFEHPIRHFLVFTSLHATLSFQKDMRELKRRLLALLLEGTNPLFDIRRFRPLFLHRL